MSNLLPFRWTLPWLVLPLMLASCAAQEFTLREELGRQWTNEYVTFPLDEMQLRKAQAGAPLLDAAGKPIVYQVVQGAEGESRLAFQVSLEPYGTFTCRFAQAGPKANQDLGLRVEEADQVVRLSNELTGVALYRVLPPGRGPLAGVRLNSGRWVAGSLLITDAPVTDYRVEITARGPVMAEARITMAFGDQGTWEARYRLFAHEPVVLVDERSAVDAKAMVRLVLSENFNAERLFFRNGDAPYGKNNTVQIQNGTVFQWEPWLRWHASNQRGSTFSVYNSQETDLLSVAAREAGAWVDPALPREKQAPQPLPLVRDDEGLHLDLPLMHGQRKWMLGAFDRDASLAVLQDPAQELASPIPYRYLIKYGHFPLDMIKDYVLHWPHQLEHPRMIMTRRDVERFQANVADREAYQRKVEEFLAYQPGVRGTELNPYNLDEAIPAYLATQDPRMAELMAKRAVEMLQAMANSLIDQEGLPFGAAPHHHSALPAALGLADAIYDSPQTTPELRERLRVLAAFLGYTTARPEYWSPARGYAANPNMTTSVYGYRASLAAFIPDHPCAKQWIEEGLTELKHQLDTWSDDNGGWLEAPHYAMVSYDQILAVLVMAYNAGFNDWLYSDPKVKKVIQWFAKIDTPPDSRIGGFRHRPAIGNTYMNEPCGEYGLLAYLFREKDPEFSAEMQWQYKQNNMYGTPGIGGFFPAFAGYRKILTDPTLPEKAPNYGSELFPQTGVVLRDWYPSERETYLHMILGNNHAHYDDDSGSIILYGKGRVLSDEFGYYGYIPQEDHSMVESPAAGHGVMRVRDFATHPRFDYVAGVKEAWTRQIALVKGATPDAPTYFVINDALQVSSPATWRLWLTAQEVQVGPQSALVVGQEDVDMDVFFLAPQGVPLKTESKTRRSGSGMFPNWGWGPMETTQIGLIAAMERTAGFSTLLYPRLKTEKPPAVTVLAEGKGVKVTHSAGTDYVFLSNTPFTYDEGDLHFEGMAGMVQLRGEEVILALGSGGKLSARGKTAASDQPLPVASRNLFPNGDFETGKLDPFPARDDETLKVSVYEGNPVPGDTTHGGKYCLALTLKQGGSNVSARHQVPVDPEKVYRIGLNAYADSATVTTIGGYGVNPTTPNVRDAEGRIWQWSLVVRGPTEGWQRLETTIGPPASGAPLVWPPGISATHLVCWIGGEPGTLYLDDVAFEPLD